MSYKIKTLIVFDTNSLRSTDAGEVAYIFLLLADDETKKILQQNLILNYYE